jgi:hypothetical protein
MTWKLYASVSSLLQIRTSLSRRRSTVESRFMLPFDLAQGVRPQHERLVS